MNVSESFLTWRGTRKQLRRNLRLAATFEEWCTYAKDLDTYLGNDEWCETDRYAYYDYKLIRKVWLSLRTARISNDLEATKATLETCVKANFSGIESARLYSQTYYGTKLLINGYVDEVELAIKRLLESSSIPRDEKKQIFRRWQTNYGRTALCLSGGACFAYYHFGVARALLDCDLIPMVITGTSGGGLIAALVCTRTNDELRELLVPRLAEKLTACHDSSGTWLRRWWKTGARFDAIDWASKTMFFTKGSMTFKEAYEATGRILNISVIPHDTHSPPKLINYLTAPDCVIWSALLGSAAVPGILNPVVLMMKTATGKLLPYNFGHKWKDGSLRTDIPVQALNMVCSFKLPRQ